MSCSEAPDAPSDACIEGTATLTMLVSITAMIWPVSTMASAAPGGTTRPPRSPRPVRPATAGRAASVRSVMRSSLPPRLCWYQEPGYPGTSTTWQRPPPDGRMKLMTTAAIATAARRTELAAFLRARRERINPEDVGLPPGTRRRTAGLRREELAQLAGVGVTWYTWLEQGRPINASVQVLDAVSTTLRLDAVERAHLFRLADLPGAATAAADCGDYPLPPEVQQILDGIKFPAYVLTERFDLIAWNDVYAALFPGITEAPPGERNTLLVNLTDRPCCSPLEDQESHCLALVGQLRAAYGRHVGDPAWTHFIRRLEALSPAFAEAWASHDVAQPSSRTKRFRHP